ncbi:MAG: GNAT family N-acetyltransferase, partial [Weeksellaceae bacterium]|nr:GNAT family N-acetyltransferase [Weeksellaceae bacterium]
MTQFFRFSEQKKYDLETISNFNDHCFSIRKPHHFYDKFRFVENPFAGMNYDYLYGAEKNEKYVAQMLTMPAPLSLNGKEIPAFWGQDYFVLEENRGEGIGKELANYYLKKDYYIAVGFSSKSAVIHQKMGAK